jgi:hypothetical protein
MKRVLERTSCRKEIDLKIISKVPLDTVTTHLKSRGSALSLPFNPSDYQAFHVQMEQGDEKRIVLWWENEKATKDRDCRLVNSDDSAGAHDRVQSFIHGNAKGLEPADLRSSPNLEPVAVTNELDGNFWYLIDGSHRSIAQFRSKKSFEGASIFVCVHPQIMNWPNIPSFYK